DAMIILRAAEPKIEEANPENQFHYHYNKGITLMFLEDYKEALKHFSMAYELDYVEVKPHAHMIHYNMGLCYSKLGVCIRAITQFETAYNLLDREQPYYFAMFISNNLSVEYIRAKDLGLAKKYIGKTLRLAVKLGDEKHYQLALQNAGCANIKENKFEKALEYFEKSLDYAEEGENSYFDTLFYKMFCLISSKHPSAELELSVAMLTSKDNNHFLTLFVALSHLKDLKSEEAEDFIENSTIPWLMKRKEYYRIQYIYQFMINHYTELEYEDKVLEVQAKSDDLYKTMLLGGEEFEEEEEIDLLSIDFNTSKPSD
ncbi:MAG: tetratricopeptide repeat protein, partial [Defluviitaleaceae bacterium]|nr:tetratricopeptide repeat protein [Defluviitaleaceae bacterium]